MFRRLVAVALLVSITAMITSGMAMFVIEQPSFTISMHPVHKLFGLVLSASAIAHIFLNRRSIFGHLKKSSGALLAVVLTAGLILLYSVALQTDRTTPLARTLDEAGAAFEHAREPAP